MHAAFCCLGDRFSLECPARDVVYTFRLLSVRSKHDTHSEKKKKRKSVVTLRAEPVEQGRKEGEIEKTTDRSLHP